MFSAGVYCRYVDHMNVVQSPGIRCIHLIVVCGAQGAQYAGR